MGKRKVVTGPNLPGHPGNPIPACVVVDNLILPSVIVGADPGKGIVKDPEKQVEQAFVNMKTIVEAAGGSLDTVGKVTVYLKDMKYREILNKVWVQVFPEENNRPARHYVKFPDLPGDIIIQLDVIATRV